MGPHPRHHPRALMGIVIYGCPLDSSKPKLFWRLGFFWCPASDGTRSTATSGWTRRQNSFPRARGVRRLTRNVPSSGWRSRCSSLPAPWWVPIIQGVSSATTWWTRGSSPASPAFRAAGTALTPPCGGYPAPPTSTRHRTRAFPVVAPDLGCSRSPGAIG